MSDTPEPRRFFDLGPHATPIDVEQARNFLSTLQDSTVDFSGSFDASGLPLPPAKDDAMEIILIPRPWGGWAYRWLPQRCQVGFGRISQASFKPGADPAVVGLALDGKLGLMKWEWR
ncbi:MAG: hypothetical protein KGR26_16330, partial [Cyanobacteria bacterium REEB65]|nr:hypothetical protein [Cyanobacteria bacterium REEB65]